MWPLGYNVGVVLVVRLLLYDLPSMVGPVLESRGLRWSSLGQRIANPSQDRADEQDFVPVLPRPESEFRLPQVREVEGLVMDTDT